jgi:glycosyltransferase involved in cell wall biosynthesis
MSHEIGLTIAYATLATRAHQISLPRVSAGTEILVCVQGGAVSSDARLDDARIVPVAGRGVAKSRNVSMDHARGRYLLFCDDDVLVDLPGVEDAIQHLRRTGIALALGQGMSPTGLMRKSYPQSVRRLTRFNSAKAATYEMLIDLEQVRATGVRFDERFGAGAELYLGDEYIFIADLLEAGLAGEAIPVVFGTHPEESSGSLWGTAEDRHVRAVAINRVFGRWSFGARLAFGLKNRSNLGGWGAVAGFLADGTGPPRAQDVGPGTVEAGQSTC